MHSAGGADRSRFDDLARNVLVGSRVLDQREDATRHEPGRPYGSPAPGHLRDRHDAATGLDLDPAAVPGRDDLIGADLPTRIYDDLHAITAHALTLPRVAHLLSRAGATHQSNRPARLLPQHCALGKRPRQP
jgi:hypothetical protein